MLLAKRYENNPLIKPRDLEWEAKATFNPAAIKIKNKIYLIYRAMSYDNVSTFGLAILEEDGVTIEYRSDIPIYYPRMHFEMKYKGYKNTGVEDPRVFREGKWMYITYTAVGERFDYVRVALTKIKVKDFVRGKYNWELPKLISPPGIDDKDCAITKIKNRYAIIHRFVPDIWIDFVDNLDEKFWVYGERIMRPRKDKWDSERIGIASELIKVNEGYLGIYHGRDFNGVYRLGVFLMDKENYFTIIRPDWYILEPKEWYEKKGQVNNVVFSNGHVLLNDEIYIYYGASDKYIALATINLNDILAELIK